MRKRIMKLTSFVLVFMMLLSSIVVPTSAEDESTSDSYILYEEDFEDVEGTVEIEDGHNLDGAAAGWIFDKKGSTTAQARIENGRLYLSGNKYAVLYRDGGQTWGNYTVEADMCYAEDNKNWCGLLYNVQSSTTFQKAGIEPDGGASLNGMTPKADGSNQWINNVTGVNNGITVEDAPVIGQAMRMKVVVYNKTANFYYALLNEDGSMKTDYTHVMSIDNIPAASQTGSIGFMCPKTAHFGSIWVDNIKCYSNTLVSYSEDFSEYGDVTLTANEVNTTIGLNYVHNENVTGSASIKDGKLYLSGGGKHFDAVFFTMGYHWTNYVVESDFTYVSRAHKSSWAGLMFRSVDIDNFYKGAVNVDGSGVLNCQEDGSWYNNTDRTATFCDGLEYNQTFRWRIVVNETTASLYSASYDGNGALGEWEHVVTIDKEEFFAGVHEQGTVGCIVGGAADARTAEIWVDNVTVSRIEGADRVIEPANVANIYETESGIVNPPVVVQELEDTLPSVTGERAAVVMMEVDESLNILKNDGSVLTTAASFIDTYRKVLIPAFIVDSEAEADALATLIDEKDLIDCYVVADSKNAALVRRVRMANETTSYISGALIFDDLNSLAARQNARALVADYMSYVAISREPLSDDAAHYFNLRQIAAWSYAADTAGVYQGIANGYHGIVSTDVSDVYDVYESITDTTVSGKPVIIAHRGANASADPQYPENTVLGFRAAKEVFGADAVELDFQLTSDGYLVLMHDTTVDRTTSGTGNVSSFTLEEIKTLTVDYVAGMETTVPTFEEALEVAKELDIVLYCHTKSNTDANIAAFSHLVEKHQAWDYVVLFAADHTTYNSNNESVAPESTAYAYDNQAVVTDGIVFTAGNQTILTDLINALPTISDGDMLREGVVAMRTCIAPYNYQPLFYGYYKQGDVWNDDSFYYQLSARGFVNSHSVVDGQATMDSVGLTGAGAVGFLTNNLHLCDDYHYGFDLSDEKLVLPVGETLELTKTMELILESLKIECNFIQLSGPTLVSTENGYTLSDEGTVTLVYYADRTADGGSTYRVYSEPVTLTFYEEDSVDENGAGFTFLGGSLRMDYEDYDRTSLRFGYRIKLPEGATLNSWSWSYTTASPDTVLYAQGVNKVENSDGTIDANLVITGIPRSYFDLVITAKMKIVYTLEGTVYTLEEPVIRERSVNGVANSILDSATATQEEKDYANLILQ